MGAFAAYSVLMSTVSGSRVDGPADGWLVRHRWKAALTIAVVEGVIAAVHGTSRWIMIGVAVIVLFGYIWWGRATESALGAQLAWIAAASQALVLLLATVAFLVGLFVLMAVGALAVVALVLLFLEPG